MSSEQEYMTDEQEPEMPTSALLETVTVDAFERTAERPRAIFKQQGTECVGDILCHVDQPGYHDFEPTIHPMEEAINKLVASITPWVKKSSDHSVIARGAVVATLLWVNEAMKADAGQEDLQSIIARAIKSSE